MRVVEDIATARKELDVARARGRRVGIVATMGALHEGHASLVRRAAGDCDEVAVTVFVNPLQFDAPADLAAYPRDLEADARVAEAAGASVLVAPGAGEMWEADRSTTVRVAGLDEHLEGAGRPGHLTGVATVVTKLFAVLGPGRAYFGEKDYQQLLIVRRLVRDLGFAVDVVACPTVREPDGLACSSRNRRLGPEDRAAAGVLHRALRRATAAIGAGERRAGAVRRLMAAEVAAESRVALAYAEVADPDTLEPSGELTGPSRLLVAGVVGGVRLIDNVAAPAPGAGRGSPAPSAGRGSVAA